jgi:CDGSH-type Zn-finger protein
MQQINGYNRKLRIVQMNKGKLIPHFVADRPMSLRILCGLNLKRHPVNIGLMVQACSSQSFRKMVSNFPCCDINYCGVIDSPCPYKGDIKKCSKGLVLKDHFTTIADSGVFTKNGSSLDYPSLFSRYNKMKIERGIILDVLGDKKKTIKSAKEGWDVYSSDNYDFTLIGVTQGNNVKEYVKCYEMLLKIGYEEIAIGGLLTKHENTARYASSNRQEISQIVKKIRSEWPDMRCFTLGVYNPKRHEFLESLGVDAADYKGWIFQYKRKYSDPLCHHIDRIFQTRNFIEKNILSLMSGRKESDNCVHTMAKKMKNQLSIQGKRVVVDKKIASVEKDMGKQNQVVIISCGKSKNKCSKCHAKDAYNGQAFLLKKKYAELTGHSWFILSAKYGLLKPETTIDPNYNVTISTKKERNHLTSIIKQQLQDFLEFSIADELIFLGPEAYAMALEAVFEGKDHIKLTHITKGLTQGKSQKKIRELIDQSLVKPILALG